MQYVLGLQSRIVLIKAISKQSDCKFHKSVLFKEFILSSFAHTYGIDMMNRFRKAKLHERTRRRFIAFPGNKLIPRRSIHDDE